MFTVSYTPTLQRLQRPTPRHYTMFAASYQYFNICSILNLQFGQCPALLHYNVCSVSHPYVAMFAVSFTPPLQFLTMFVVAYIAIFLRQIGMQAVRDSSNLFELQNFKQSD